MFVICSPCAKERETLQRARRCEMRGSVAKQLGEHFTHDTGDIVAVAVQVT